VHCRAPHGLQQELAPEFPARIDLPPQVAVEPRILKEMQRCFSRSLLARVRRKLAAAGGVLAGLRP
jgi:hypothetical protein